MAVRPINRQRKADYSSGNAWMLTFADLLSLLLTFFVLVFSMNTVKYENWKAVVRTMSEEFNPNRPQISPAEHQLPELQAQPRIKGMNLAYLEAVVERSFKQIPLFQSGEVWRNGDRVIISIPASVLFERKQAIISKEAAKAMQDLAGVLLQLRNKVQVAGYTDSAPMTTRLFRSNWELSLTRARIVAGIIADAGIRDPIAVMGYADTRFSQLSDSLPRERRYDLAERIDIIVIDERRGRGPYDLF